MDGFDNLQAILDTINRFHRWARKGLWRRILEALAVAAPDGMHLIDSTTAKAHRSAASAKGAQA